MANTDYGKLFKRVVRGELILNVSSDFAFEIAAFEGEPDSDRYFWARVKCRICEYEFLTVYPDNVLDESCLECESCTHLCCEPVANDELILDFSDG